MERWDDVRFFLAIARESSLSGAARALRVDHAPSDGGSRRSSSCSAQSYSIGRPKDSRLHRRAKPCSNRQKRWKRRHSLLSG